MKILKSFILLLCLYPFALCALSDELSWMTEESPPYNFTESGKIQGIAVDILELVFEKGNIPTHTDQIKVYPWARGYYDAQVPGMKNVIFSTTRTESREPLFKWVGPIFKTKISIFTLKKSDIVLDRVDEFSKITFVAVRDDIGEQLLRKQGVTNIEVVKNLESALKMLRSGRAQAFAYEENVGKWFMRAQGLGGSDLKIAKVLQEGDLYYAFNKSISDEVVSKYQSLIDTVTSDQELMQEILDRYLK